MPTELELKLGLDPKVAARVTCLPLLRRLAAQGPTTRTLKAIYFDTPDADLRRLHVALRLRSAGRHWSQTLKEERVAAGGLHVRGESEHPVARGALELGKIEDARLRKKLEEWQAMGELGPRFETAVRRTTWLLKTAGGGVVEVALDRGQVRTCDGGRNYPLCEVELELKSGPPSALFALARELAGLLPLALEHRSKAERGYALWRREPLSKPTKAGPLLLDAHATAAEAMAQIVGNGVSHLHRNWQAARAASRYDPEHVHQMRVASRRLRTAFTVFGQLDSGLKAHPLTAELRWLAQLLGEARNCDVLLAETVPQLLATFPDEPGLPALVHRARIQRQRARLAVGEALRSARYFSLVLDLDELIIEVRKCPALAVPATAVAANMLTRRHRQLRKRAKRLAKLSETERHALRIAAKKLRYTAEYFRSLFAGGKLDRFLRRFSELQEVLGLLNDLATTRGLLSVFAAGADAETQRALGLCVGWSAEREQQSLSELVRCWKGVERAPRFWPESRGKV